MSARRTRDKYDNYFYTFVTRYTQYITYLILRIGLTLCSGEFTVQVMCTT